MTEDDLQSWTQNKLRGFKRVSPSASSTNKSKPSAPAGSNTNTSKQSKSKMTPGKEAPERVTPTPETPPENRLPGRERKQYCHYYVNQGKCHFEDKTGEKCRFAHEQAPMCRSGMACNRNKCMFSHPNVGGTNNTHFLDRSRGPHQMMNTWPMINPWMNSNQFPQFPNPWGMDGNPGRN